MNDLLAIREGIHVGEVFRQGLARHGQAIPFDRSFLEQVLHHRRSPTHVVQILHDVFSAGLEVREVGNSIANFLKIVDV